MWSSQLSNGLSSQISSSSVYWMLVSIDYKPTGSFFIYICLCNSYSPSLLPMCALLTFKWFCFSGYNCLWLWWYMILFCLYYCVESFLSFLSFLLYHLFCTVSMWRELFFSIGLLQNFRGRLWCNRWEDQIKLSKASTG